MVAKRGGLGRNLSALLNPTTSSDKQDEDKSVRTVALAINTLQPGKYQPRRVIDDTLLDDLTASIKQHGLLQPLVVRAISANSYEIIAGERRWRACERAGMLEVPVIVRDVNDETAMALALIENLQREDLSAMDEAYAIQRLVCEFSLTHQNIANLLCKSRAAVSNSLRLLNLTAEIKSLLEQGALEMGHARALLMLTDAAQVEAGQRVVLKKLSVRETEALVARINSNKPVKETSVQTDPECHEHAQALALHLQTKVKIKQRATGSGTLLIHYDNTHMLDAMMGLLINSKG